MSYTVSEILKSVIGLDEYGKPKTAVAFNISKIDEITGMREEKSSAQVCNAKVRIIKVSDFITIDLIFANKYASELNKFWSIIELYGEEITNREDLNTDIPVAGALTIVPVAFQGKIFISAVNPIYWTLMPSTPAANSKTEMPFIIGDLEEAVTNFDRQQFSIAASNEATISYVTGAGTEEEETVTVSAFQNNLTFFRAFMRNDFKSVDSSAWLNCTITA